MPKAKCRHRNIPLINSRPIQVNRSPPLERNTKDIKNNVNSTVTYQSNLQQIREKLSESTR